MLDWIEVRFWLTRSLWSWFVDDVMKQEVDKQKVGRTLLSEISLFAAASGFPSLELRGPNDDCKTSIPLGDYLCDQGWTEKPPCRQKKNKKNTRETDKEARKQKSTWSEESRISRTSNLFCQTRLQREKL